MATQRLRRDPQITRHLRDRPTRLDHRPGAPLQQLRRVLAWTPHPGLLPRERILASGTPPNPARLNQLTSTNNGSTTNYTYDANGNQATAGATTFTYDLANRQTSATTGGVTSTYAYDGDDNRVQSTTSGGGADLRYTWDPLAETGIPEIATERDPSTGSLIRRYLTTPFGAASMTNASAAFYYHQDPRGDVTDQTNASGTAQWLYQYEPYGAPRTTTNVSGTAPENRLGFNGQYLDPGTSLYDLRARMYNPATGLFGAVDPLQAPLTTPAFGTYSYAYASPMMFSDPAGTMGGATSCTTQSGPCIPPATGGFLPPKISATIKQTLKAQVSAVKESMVRKVDNWCAFHPQTPDCLWDAARETVVGIKSAVDVAIDCAQTREAEPCTIAGVLAFEGLCPIIGGKIVAPGRIGAVALDGAAGDIPALPPIAGGAPMLPADAKVVTSFPEIARRLADNHGIDPVLASDRLHAIKQRARLGRNEDVIFDRTGGVYDAMTGELLGSLTEGGSGRRK